MSNKSILNGYPFYFMPEINIKKKASKAGEAE